MPKRQLLAMMEQLSDPTQNSANSSSAASAEKAPKKPNVDQLRERAQKNIIGLLLNQLNYSIRGRYTQAQSIQMINQFIAENSAIQDLISQLTNKLNVARIPAPQKENLLDTYFKPPKKSIQLRPQLPQSIPEFLRSTVSLLKQSLDEQTFDPCLSGICLSAEEEDNVLTELDGMILDSQLACAPTDGREHYTHERYQRRYDSLARLLSLKQGFSVVSAVTIVDGELIIGANSSGNESSDLLAETLRQKVGLIRRFLNQVGRSDFNEDDLPTLIIACVVDLYATGGTSQNQALLAQALLKLVNATRPLSEEAATPDSFSTIETAAILGAGSFTLLLPAGKIKNSDEIESHLSQFSANSESMVQLEPIPVGESLRSSLVRHFHAEQLIAYYLQHTRHYNLNDEAEPKIRIGVSKLCCKTCNHAFQNLSRLQTRGTHGVEYEGTVDLLNSTVCQPAPVFGSPVRTKLRSPTHAFASPFFSPGASGPASASVESPPVVINTMACFSSPSP